jgi:hypothetical protein
MENKRQKQKEFKVRIMATVLAGLMIFSALAGALIYLFA